MLNFLTVNATRSNISQVDLVNYTGNPLIAPLGLLRTGHVFNPSDLTMAAINPNRIRAAGGFNMNPFGALNPAPVMWLTADGTFVFSKHHRSVGLLPLHKHLENLKVSYPEGAEIKVVSMMEVGNTYINMNNSDVVTFEEKVGEAVPFKRDEAGKWVVFNRLSGEWVEPVLHMAVDNHFRVETIDMVHVSVIAIDGADLHLTLDAEGFIHDVELMDEDGRANISAFELSDDNTIFKFLIPHGWETTTPVKAETDGNKNIISSPIGGPLGASW